MGELLAGRVNKVLVAAVDAPAPLKFVVDDVVELARTDEFDIVVVVVVVVVVVLDTGREV